MIEISRCEIHGWDAAVRGMRNPMNSWDRSDSKWVDGKFDMGQNDFSLACKLASAGNDHAKFLRMIHVQFDVLAPLYFWKELDTYKVGTVANSCSTMHKVHAKPFVKDDFSHEHLMEGWETVLDYLIRELNHCREQYIATNDKTWWWQIIQLLPTSYNQLRTFDCNYAVLRNIYHSRRGHKLDEWHTFCEFIESLPYSYLITNKGAVTE